VDAPAGVSQPVAGCLYFCPFGDFNVRIRSCSIGFWVIIDFQFYSLKIGIFWQTRFSIRWLFQAMQIFN
jgi:hypothetical protein